MPKGPFTQGWLGRRQTQAELVVLGCLHLGLGLVTEIMLYSGLGSGRIYPALYRLQQQGLIQGTPVEKRSGLTRWHYTLVAKGE